MRILALPVLTLIAFTALGQNSKKIDSLKRAAAKGDAATYLELYRMFREHDSASYYLQKALTYVDDKALESRIRRGYTNLYLSKGFYSMAQKQAFESLKLALEVQDSAQIASSYMALGSTAYYSHLYDKAAEFDNEGIKYSPNNLIRNGIKNNYGLVLMEQNELYKSTGIYQELLREAKDSLQLSAIHNNLGTVFLRLKNYDSAYNHVSKTLNLSIGMRNNTRIMFNTKLMGQYYYGIGDFDKAKLNFLEALKLNETYSEVYSLWNFLELPELFRCMTDIYKQEKNTDSLLWLQEKQINFQKQLLEKHRKNSGEFIFDTQEGELSQLKQRERQARKNQIEYYGIALAILVALIGYFLFSGKDKQRKYSPYISVVILVLVFEFMLIVSEPLINNIAGDDPLYNFLCNVVLAFLIIPVQLFGERIMRRFAIDIKVKRLETTERV